MAPAAPPGTRVPRLRPRGVRLHRAKEGTTPTFWGLHLALGQRARVKVPAGCELRITTVCSNTADGRASVSVAPEEGVGQGAGHAQFRCWSFMPSRVSLAGDVTNVWSLRIDAALAGTPGLEVDLTGYLVEVSQDEEGWLELPAQEEEEEEEQPKPVAGKVLWEAPRSSKKREAAAGSTSKTTATGGPKGVADAPRGPAAVKATAAAPPQPEKPAPPAPYNPLRPAAKAVVGSAISAKTVLKGSPQAAATGAPRTVLKLGVGEMKYEERGHGSELANPRRAETGEKVKIRFSILTCGQAARGKKAANEEVERGEIECRLGKKDVLDGWVDGNVDLESVLAPWSKNLVGMRVGDKRRIHVPAGKGIRDGEGLDASMPLFWDVEMRQVLFED